VLLISSLADGNSSIKNLADGEDVKSTLKCLNSLGIETEIVNDKLIVHGKGFKGYKSPSEHLNARNSGTTARLMSGILAVQNFESVIEGDKSLSSRPMNRVIEPLFLMGCIIKSNNGKLPLKIFPLKELKPISYELSVASAQVKSAILLAGLYLEEETSVIESQFTRNHTEKLLGLNIRYDEDKIISYSSRKNYPQPQEYFIPGDISTAIYFIVLALLSENSELLIKNVSLNYTRTEVFSILKAMGANIQIEVKGESNKEPYGDLLVKSSKLSNVILSSELIPLVIDEIPILAVAGIFAEGEFEIRNVSELRVKESDRVKSLVSNFTSLGLNIEEYSDGFRISGEIKKTRGNFSSFGDHRIAMACAVLSMLLKDGGNVEGFESVSVSNPGFLDQLQSIIR
jgi:3-phosphoshikimate 1-carboxyvinyltransferase